MAGSIQITYRLLITFFLFSFFSAQEKWNYSAEEMEQIKANGQKIQRLKGKVRFSKKDHIILTDNAVQYMKDDVLHMNGNTIMINGLDTLTCDSMVYWSNLDSGYAMGNVHYIQPEKGRLLTTEVFHYWQTEGYRGSSFITNGYTRIIEPNQLITANAISYDDNKERMKLNRNASVESPNHGIFGDAMIVQYADSLITEINVTSHAFAYNDLSVRLAKDGPYRQFRDEMSSRKMNAHFKDDKITQLELISMARTYYHVITDSLLAGNNEASGDSIHINFLDGNISRLQVVGGALGEFNPEGNNTKIDTSVFYGAEYLDYYINNEKTFLRKGAYVEYQNTTLSAGEIVVDWQTNILDAIKVDEEYPMVKTGKEEPMKGNSMIFDLVAKHGRIQQGRTSFNQSFYHGKQVFRDDPNVFHVNKSKYTSCELEHPHFYLGSRKMKILPGDKVVAKPLWLHIYDIPIMGIPSAVFPNKGGKRHSGWIMPSFDSYGSLGTGFRNFGYYWAPNDYMDAKMGMNFFDKEGMHLNSSLKYKRRYGKHWYNYKLNGNLNATFKRRITTNEIMDLTKDNLTNKIFRLTWNHSQSFDPTQQVGIKYEYISNKDAYQNNQEVSLQNRLKQNLSSSFHYSKNWQSSSFSIGLSQFRDLSIENKTPDSFNYLNEDRYKSYKYDDGPKFNFRLGSRKIFSDGNSWYNSLTSSYTMKASKGRDDHWLIKESDSTWADDDTLKRQYGGIKHSITLSAPQTFFRWLTINPNISLQEDWIYHYKIKENAWDEGADTSYTYIQEIAGFKRRLTWNSSITAKTSLYGLLPVSIGRLSALRHVITPRLSFTYRPDFSDAKYGGDSYFQQMESGELFDYFDGSYVGSTSHQENRSYSMSINNIIQAKIRNQDGGYNKSNILTSSSAISYNPLKDKQRLSEMLSSIRIKSFSGNDLFRVNMHHNFYRLNDEGLIDIFGGDFPRLTYIDIVTDIKFTLSDSEISDIDKLDNTETVADFDDGFYNADDDKKSIKNQSGNLWQSNLDFSYRTKWREETREWDYTFFLNTRHKINLSRNWALTYTANFNLKEKEIIRNKLSIYRPLHCWEFSFSFWPQGISSGFSLEINVKNPDLKDIRVISSDSNRGFGSY